MVKQSTLQNDMINAMTYDLINRAKAPRSTITSACKIVAKKLDCHHKTVLIISKGGYAGKKLQERIRQVYNTGEFNPRVRWGCITDMESEEDLRKVQKLSMAERRRRLLNGLS